MLTVFSEYNAIKNGMAELIDVSGYKNDFIAKKIGMTSANFSVKKQRGNWSEKEMEKIINLLTSVNEDVEDLLMLKVAKARENEPTVNFADYKKQRASWK